LENEPGNEFSFFQEMTEVIQPECPICFESNATLCLPCSNYHWVHRTCWAKVVNKTICPICNQSVATKLLIPSISIRRGNESDQKTERHPQPVRDYSYLLNVIRRITDWNTRTNCLERSDRIKIDFIRLAISQGHTLNDRDVNYVYTVQYSMLIYDSEISQIVQISKIKQQLQTQEKINHLKDQLIQRLEEQIDQLQTRAQIPLPSIPTDLFTQLQQASEEHAHPMNTSTSSRYKRAISQLGGWKTKY
jgi:hypothetical protein